MFKHSPLFLAFLTICFATFTPLPPASARGGDEKPVVEVNFATKHVPEGLKAGSKVDLISVNAETITRTGKAYYSTSTLIKNIEVISVTHVKKPKFPELAVKVKLRVTSRQAEIIEKAKTRVITTVRNTPGGGTITEMRPITLRLQMIKSARPKGQSGGTK